MKAVDLVVGQRLWCTNGESVIIRKILDHELIVEYKGKLYIRNKNVLGLKLLVHQPPKLDETHFKCTDCTLYRNDTCFGRKKTCEDFKCAPQPSSSELSRWPQYGDATYFRFKKTRGFSKK